MAWHGAAFLRRRWRLGGQMVRGAVRRRRLGVEEEWRQWLGGTEGNKLCSNGLSSLRATKSFGCAVTHREDQKRTE
ncbi:hypothetical protein OsI_18287 [Oryza sativa Indica Group]|uniref:Uncharacterized protein n=1 Tax=Oryza sativa subsp. indica TaxID=39946 RepID=A2XZX8_ORYSI|nr:hypothetical protein OsI_18287 [Oryza sativa Indica Group]